MERALDLLFGANRPTGTDGDDLPPGGPGGLPPPGPRHPPGSRPGARPERGQPRRGLPAHPRGLPVPVAGGGRPGAAPGRAAHPGNAPPARPGITFTARPCRTGRCSSPSSSTTRAAPPGGTSWRPWRGSAASAPPSAASPSSGATSPTRRSGRSSTGAAATGRRRSPSASTPGSRGFLSADPAPGPPRPPATPAAPDRPVLRRDAGSWRRRRSPPSTRTSSRHNARWRRSA